MHFYAHVSFHVKSWFFWIEGNIVGHPTCKMFLDNGFQWMDLLWKDTWMHDTIIIIQWDFREFEHWFCWETFGPWDFDSCLAICSIYRVVQTLIKMVLKGFYVTKNCFSFIFKVISTYGPSTCCLQLHFLFTVWKSTQEALFLHISVFIRYGSFSWIF